MNILIINAHSSKNKGDAGIVLSMIDAIKKNNKDCKIKIHSRFPKIDDKFYTEQVSSCVDNVSIDPGRSKFLKLGSAVKLLLTLLGMRKIQSKDYEWADVVVSCGGGFLLSHGFSVALMQHLVQIKTAFDYKKPVIIYSQSIGPFYNNFMRILTRKVLNGVSRIYIRETVSKEWLTKIKCNNPNIYLVPDSAFFMNEEKTECIESIYQDIRSNHVGPLIGLTVRDWNFPEVEDVNYYRNKYIESLREAINHMAKKYNAKIILMPQVLGPNPFNDDRIISREVLDVFTNEVAELLDADLHPRELKSLYSKMDMFIGTRMHSNIFSLSSFVPTVAINYEHKTKGIMEMLELDNFVIDINDIEKNKFINMIEECWMKKNELRQELQTKIPIVIEEAQIPAKNLL